MDIGAEKPLKRSVSFAIPRVGNGGRVLAVRRPPEDEELPDVWGLPAGSLREGEGREEAVIRAGREKLGVEVGVGLLVRQGRLEREGYRLEMHLYEARIVRGEPEVPQPVEGVTQYTDWDWVRPESLRKAARRGSLCTRLYLEERGVPW